MLYFCKNRRVAKNALTYTSASHHLCLNPTLADSSAKQFVSLFIEGP